MSLYTIIEILLIIALVPFALAGLSLLFWILTRWQTWIPIGIVVLACVSWYVDGARHVEKARQQAAQESETKAQAFAQYVNDLKVRYKSSFDHPIEHNENQRIHDAISCLPYATQQEIHDYAFKR